MIKYCTLEYSTTVWFIPACFQNTKHKANHTLLPVTALSTAHNRNKACKEKQEVHGENYLW